MNDKANTQVAGRPRPIGILLLLLVPQLCIAAFVVWRGVNPNDYLFAIAPKQRLAASLADQPNLLLVGGSSVAWGSDSETFSKACSMPCVNLAINAGQGLDYRFNEALKYSGPGDIIVLTLEYYELEPDPSGYIPTKTFAHVPSTITLSGPSEIRAMFDNGFYELLARRTRSTVTALRGTEPSDELYDCRNFNEAGDFVGHHGKEPDNQDNWGAEVPADTQRAFEKLDRFLKSAQAKDVEVYCRLPCIPKSLADDQVERLREIESDFKSKFGERMLNELEETFLPDDSFFDTSYHLVQNEKMRVSQILAERLKQKRIKSGHPVGGNEADPQAARTVFPLAVVPEIANSWSLSRGDPQSTGVAKGELGDDLEVLWEFNVKNGAFDGTAAIAVVDEEAVVYIGDLDAKLYSFNLESGELRWEFEVKSEIGFTASPSVQDGLIYIGDIDGMFYCIDDQGQEVWSRQTEAEISSSANFYKDNVVFGSQDATLYCLNAKTGEEVWTLEADDQIQGMPTIVDGRAFIAGCDARLHAIDLDDGKELGSVEIDSPTGATVAAMGDSVYFGTEQAGFLAVRWDKPELKWRFSDESGAAIRCNPAVFSNHVIYGAGDRVLRSLDPETKKENWTRTLKGRIESSPVIVGQRVYIGSGDRRLYALELETGEICWEKEFDGGFVSSPAVAFGRMIIATDRGTVYCLGTQTESTK